MDKKVIDSNVIDAASRAEDTGLETGKLDSVAEYANEKPSNASKQLHRTFSARHIQMIGLAGSIGSGLFIGMGKVSSST